MKLWSEKARAADVDLGLTQGLSTQGEGRKEGVGRQGEAKPFPGFRRSLVLREALDLKNTYEQTRRKQKKRVGPNHEPYTKRKTAAHMLQAQ